MIDAIDVANRFHRLGVLHRDERVVAHPLEVVFVLRDAHPLDGERVRAEVRHDRVGDRGVHTGDQRDHGNDRRHGNDVAEQRQHRS
jgi:(p)ppGpp synthase/HD superfamily hydrolase